MSFPDTFPGDPAVNAICLVEPALHEICLSQERFSPTMSIEPFEGIAFRLPCQWKGRGAEDHSCNVFVNKETARFPGTDIGAGRTVRGSNRTKSGLKCVYAAWNAIVTSSSVFPSQSARSLFVRAGSGSASEDRSCRSAVRTRSAVVFQQPDHLGPLAKTEGRQFLETRGYKVPVSGKLDRFLIVSTGATNWSPLLSGRTGRKENRQEFFVDAGAFIIKSSVATSVRNIAESFGLGKCYDHIAS